MSELTPPSRRFRSSALRRLAGPCLMLVAVIAVWWGSQSWISIERLAEREAELRQLIADLPFQAGLIAFGSYVILAMFPGGQIKAVVCGWLFGALAATVLVSFASTLGACLSLLLSRSLFSGFTEKYLAPRTQWLQRAIDRDGGQYLLIFRLIPSTPFSPVNWALGVTGLKLRTCWWATQLGMLPQTAVFCTLGANLPSLERLSEKGLLSLLDRRLLLSLAALALLPLIVRWLLLRFRGIRG